MEPGKLLSKISDIIRSNKKFLLLTHSFPDGDGLGSLVALYKLIVELEKNAIMVCNSEIPYQYLFLPELGNLRRDLDEIDITQKEYVTFCLDSADERRLRVNFELIKQISKLVVNIDHHISNTNFGDINLVVSEKSATAEILYDLIKEYFEAYLGYEIALGLYTGILTDTGKFQYFNTSSRVHQIVSHLLEYNVVPSRVFASIYENEPYNRFKLIQLVLKRASLIKPLGLIYSYILKSDFERLDLPFSSHDGIIELLRTARDVAVAALFKEVDKNLYRISLRSSNSSINVADIASVFGGGGHLMAAAYVQNGKLKDVVSSLVEVTRNKIGGRIE